jgi:hypothetical protein
MNYVRKQDKTLRAFAAIMAIDRASYFRANSVPRFATLGTRSMTLQSARRM